MKGENYLDDLYAWWELLYCSECGCMEDEGFHYIRTVANGEVYFCDHCKTEKQIPNKPNEDDY